MGTELKDGKQHVCRRFPGVASQNFDFNTRNNFLWFLSVYLRHPSDEEPIESILKGEGKTLGNDWFWFCC